MIGRGLPALVLSGLLLVSLWTGTSAGRTELPARVQSPHVSEELTLLFTGETRGNLVPCSCPDGPWGGLDRRVGYLRSRRDEAEGPMLVLHSGGFLPVGAVPLRNDPEAETQLTRLLVGSFLRAEVDVLALEPGEGDYLSKIVPELWQKLGPRTLDAASPSLPRVISWGGTPVAILALDEGLADETLTELGDSARAVAELVFVLARADGISGRRIAERTRADLVILSYGVRTERPVRHADSWVVGAGREGKEIGEIRLAIGAGGLRITGYELVPMDESVPAHEPTRDLVRRLLDDFGPGWRMLVTPVE